MDTVSVIIPTYNRAHLVLDALNSVRKQTYRPIECIVVDDGSTDDTTDVVSEWKRQYGEKELSVHLIEQENRGAPVARNRGLEGSTGELVLFLDSDDMLVPDAVGALQRVLSETGKEAAYGDLLLLEENGTRERLVQKPPSDSRVLNMQRSAPLTSSVLIRSTAIDDIRWREIFPALRSSDSSWILPSKESGLYTKKPS